MRRGAHTTILGVERDDIGIAGFCKLEQMRNRAWAHAVISIDKPQVLAARVSEPKVSSRGNTAIGLLGMRKYLHPWIALCPLGEKRGAAVC